MIKLNDILNKAELKEDKLTEGKGYNLAQKYITKLKQEFRKLDDNELEEFNKEIASWIGAKY